MKALTIWQPWATLIVEGAKPFEFRGWRAPASLIGQRMVIHAAARPMKPAEVRDLWRRLHGNADQRASTCLHVDLAIEMLAPLIAQEDQRPFGDWSLSCGLGTVMVGEPRNGIEIAEEFGLAHVNDSDRDEHANWGWPMLDIEKWAPPVPARGAQGLWNWPTPEAAGL